LNEAKREGRGGDEGIDASAGAVDAMVAYIYFVGWMHMLPVGGVVYIRICTRFSLHTVIDVNTSRTS
jgi:hypothetical protein